MRERVKITRFVLGLLAVGIALYAQSVIRKPEGPTEGLAWYGLAGILFVVAMRDRVDGAGDSILPDQAPAVHAPVVSRRQRIVALVLLVISLAFSGAGLYLFRDIRPPGLAWTYHLSSVAAFLSSLVLLQVPVRWPPQVALRKPKLEHLLLIALLLLAFGMRFYRIAEQPLGVWYDEADNGLWARMILQDPSYRPVYVESTNLPAHFLYLVAGAFRLIGEGIVALRLVTALFGTLTVLVTYLLARELWGTRMGFVAGAVMAVSHWDVNFSRLAMHGVSTPFFILLVALFLFRAIKRGRTLDWGIAGISLGYALCFYVPNRLYPIVVILLLGHVLLKRRSFIKAQYRQLALFGLAAVLACAPVGLYIAQRPETFFARTQTTSVFKGKTTEQALQAIRVNAEKHLLMFNRHGDGNGRHNLPGEPMLDYVTSAFFVLGLIYALYRCWRDPFYSFLIIGFVGMISGGVFSLDFEAPQSLRAIGTLAFSHLMAFAAMARLWAEYERSFRGRWKKYAWVAVAPLLAFTAYNNIDIHFRKQANDFAVWNAYSTAETLMARRMLELGPDMDYRVIALYFETPTVRFLAPEIRPYKRLDTTASMPLTDTDNRDTVLFIDPERRSLYEEVRRYYPSAEFEEIRPPFDGPVVLYVCRLTPAEVAEIQGLVGTYYEGESWDGKVIQQRRDAQISFDWVDGTPLPEPFSVEWRGTLRASGYGAYRLGLRTSAPAELYVDETLVLEGAGEARLDLAEGNHSLRVRAVGARGILDFYWQPPGLAPQIVSTGALFTDPPVTNNGLLGRYYTNTDWRGEPALVKIDPSLALYFHILLVPRPYTVEWTGKIIIPELGSYAFGLESIDDSWLWIDEQPIVEAHVGNQYQQSQITLERGLHDIRVRFLDKSNWSHINLFWQPPGGFREIIPAEYLLPPQGSYPERVEAARPAPALPSAEQGGMELIPVAAWGGQGSSDGQFNEPRDLAVGDAGYLYVADTNNQRIQMFDLEGKFLRSWDGGDDPFVEPLAVVVDSLGQVLVLDSSTGWIQRFSAEGNYLDKLGGPDAQLYHPRGMAIDSADNLYVADTGGGRLISLSSSGAVSGGYGSMGSASGQFLEPTDAAIDAWGDLYVVDTANRRIQHLDVFGRYKGEWAIPLANAFNGPHIAMADDGTFFVTAPEPHMVQRYSPDGRLLGQWGGEGVMRIPVNLAIHGGRLYVADTLNHRIKVFDIVEQP